MNDNSDRKVSQADVLRIIDLHSVKDTEDGWFLPSMEYEAMVKEIEEL